MNTLVKVLEVESYLHPDDSKQVVVECQALDGVGSVFNLTMNFTPESIDGELKILSDITEGKILAAHGCYTVTSGGDITLHDPTYSPLPPEYLLEEIEEVFRVNSTNDSLTDTSCDKENNELTMSGFNDKYTFEQFVVGPSNQLAHASAIAVAEQPAKNYNPLFIYGGDGLGKTHLLHAIGIRILTDHPGLSVIYMSSEEFMNEMINSIRYDRMPLFREKYRNIDCLLIDDAQFLSNKDRTQEELFHTFNHLYNLKKQIVIASDKSPKDIDNLKKRIRSRFQWGMITRINPPEIETKIAIIEKKMQENKVSLPNNVAHYIASHVESNIRELEGYLIRICAYSFLAGKEIDLDLVKEVLKNV